LYAVLFLVVAFAPLRWSLIAYLLLSTIDLVSANASVGALNAAKAILLPAYLLWRLRVHAGHEKTILAPLAWGALMVYAAVAGAWSLYPMFALKLVGHMAGSLLICLVFLRATKGNYLEPAVVLPVTIGAMLLAVLRTVFAPAFGGEPERFKSFSSAQSFAAFLVALYCVVLCSKSLRFAIRLPLCGALAAAVMLNGSRLWMLGIVISTLTALLISSAPAWTKICIAGFSIVVVAMAVAEGSLILNLIAREAPSNRIAAAINAGYRGDSKSYGLGTYRLRRELDLRALDAIDASSLDELVFGHGTSNSAQLAGGLAHNPDPNRILHDEWLRVMYEWGLLGTLLWLIFFGSITLYAAQGMRRERSGYSKPLFAYLPAFALGLAGENIIAGAGNDVSVGFLLLIAFASVSHRTAFRLWNGAAEAIPLHAAA
jgi:hypothetical protein